MSELDKKIPVYDFRNINHQLLMAQALAKSERMAMFGGVWGAFLAVKRNTTFEDFFHRQVKPGRPWEAKVPLMARPEDATKFVDWSRVHPDFRFLADYWDKRVWKSHPAFLHIIAPVRATLNSLSEIFVTTPDEYSQRYQGNDRISHPTIAVIYRDDPYLDHLSSLVKRFSHTEMYLGVSTLNPHGKEPPYSLAGVISQLANGETPAESIDLVVTDGLYEGYEAFGSHTQIRLPQIGEPPFLKVLRIGSLSAEGFEKATGFKTEVVPGAKDVRKIPGQNLDQKLASMKAEIEGNWQKETPLINFRT